MNGYNQNGAEIRNKHLNLLLHGDEAVSESDRKYPTMHSQIDDPLWAEWL